jgi:dihydroflavonol-4-reductase
MEVLVTGPDGLLGSNLIRELLNKGYVVTAMTENAKPLPTIEGLPIKRIVGNLLNSLEVRTAAVGIDVVIHCAASTSMFPARSAIINKVNIGGTQNIIDACKENKVKRLIYVGTANSFGSGKLDNLGTEKNAYSSRHYGLDYMDSKYEAQQLVLENSKKGYFDALVVNPTFMIGPYDARPSSGKMILSVYNKKLPGYTLGGKNFIAVKDVASAITTALTKGRNGEAYILGNENLTYKAFFEKVAKTIDVPPPKIQLSTKMVRTYGKINSILANTFNYLPELTYELSILSSETHFYSSAKARAELELPQTPLEVAIKNCFDWFSENGYLNK